MLNLRGKGRIQHKKEVYLGGAGTGAEAGRRDWRAAVARRLGINEDTLYGWRGRECKRAAAVEASVGERSEAELLGDVYTLREALNVSRGAFYNHILRNKRSNTWFAKRREEYRILIQEVFDEYRQVLGAEKIRAILVQRGHQVSTEYVSHLIRYMGLFSIRTTAKQDYYPRLREPEKKRNVPKLQFQAERPN